MTSRTLDPPEKSEGPLSPETTFPVVRPGEPPNIKRTGLWGFWRKHGDNKIIEKDAVVVEVKEQQATPDLPPVSFTQLFRFATRLELFFDAIGIIASAAAGASMPLMSLFFGNLVQDFVNFGGTLANAQGGNADAQAEFSAAAAHFRHTAGLDASYLVYIGVGSFVCIFLYMAIWVHTGEVLAKRVRERYLQAVLRQDIAFFETVGAGEITTRIQTDTHLLQEGTSEKIAFSVTYLSGFATGMILGYVRLWRLAIVLTFSMIPCIGIMSAVVNAFVSRYKQLSLKHVAASGTIAEEVVSTVRTAQAFGIQKTLAGLYNAPIELSRIADLKAAILQGGSFSVLFFVIYGAYALAFDYGTTLINQHRATAGEVINTFYAIFIGSFSLALLAPDLQAITNGRAAAAKLYEIIDRVPPIDSASAKGLTPEKCVGEITFEHVSFNYPSRPTVPILQDLSLSFPAGKTAALVGASGSGKSTIVSLVEHFYDPLSGVVKLDGVDIRELNVRWLRSQIGLVSQEPTLFSTTIKENVAHGLVNTRWEHVSEDEKMKLIREACAKANADNFIQKLPLGYDTLVGERGFLLSGGQKQRIAIARAIVSDPHILLLDEATSALDTQSEDIVQDALDKAAAGRTTITIAHRLSTIKDADCIHVMGDGIVLESGTHAELLADENGPYSRLVQAQKLRENQTEIYADVDVTDAKVNKESADMVDEDLYRVPTTRSLASEVLEQRKVAPQKGKNYSLYYLFMRMGTINRDQWTRYLIGAILASVSGAVWPVFSIVFGKAINGFSDSDPVQRRHDGDRNALWFFIIAIIASIAASLFNILFGITASELSAKLRKLSFRAILWQDVEFFDQDENSTGVLTSGLSDKPQKVEGLAGLTLGAILQSIATLVVGFAIGISFAWKLGLVALACAPFVVTMGYIRLHIVVLKDQKNKKAHDASAQIACEAADAIRTVASLTREQDCCDIYSKSLEEPLRQSNRTSIWSAMLYAISQSMVFLVMGFIFWYGARLVSFLQIPPYHFFVTLMSTMFGTVQAGNVFQRVPDISSATSAATDIIDLLDSRPQIDSQATDGKVPNAVAGRVVLHDVHFRYPSRPGVRVLRGFNIVVEPGTYVALVGSSGCGKSTIIQLIERFYDPQAGIIYFDGQPISELNVSEYRKHIALVSQEPTLYAGTVRFNVLLGATKAASEVTQEEIEAACRNANILDFIQSLPDGFDTEVGGKGSQLSGGQKQRIAIARALLRNPKVLLLDEATSALDSNSERVVQDALDKAAKGRTTIAIAHRLSTIQNADRIYFIKDGSVSEAGTHDELLALKGGYYEYVQLQALSKK